MVGGGWGGAAARFSQPAHRPAARPPARSAPGLSNPRDRWVFLLWQAAMVASTVAPGKRPVKPGTPLGACSLLSTPWNNPAFVGGARLPAPMHPHPFGGMCADLALDGRGHG